MIREPNLRKKNQNIPSTGLLFLNAIKMKMFNYSAVSLCIFNILFTKLKDAFRQKQ